MSDRCWAKVSLFCWSVFAQLPSERERGKEIVFCFSICLVAVQSDLSHVANRESLLVSISCR